MIFFILLFFFVTISSVEISQFTQSWYHQGPYVQTLMFFAKEGWAVEPKISHKNSSQRSALCTITFDKSSISSLKRSLTALGSRKKEVKLFVSAKGNTSILQIAYNPQKTAVLCYQLNSDRFGSGVACKVYALTHIKNKKSLKEPLRIMIDCGHGGSDSGAHAVNGLYEKDITRTIGVKVAQALKAEGYSVQLTSENDVTLPIDQRTTRANNYYADLCISLHADSCSKPNKRGVSIRVPSHSLLKSLGSLKESLVDRHVGEFENTRYDRSLLLAKKLVNLLSQSLEVPVIYKYDPFQLLLGTQMPALLIEMGFLSNTLDVEMLLSDKYQQILIAAILKTIKTGDFR